MVIKLCRICNRVHDSKIKCGEFIPAEWAKEVQEEKRLPKNFVKVRDYYLDRQIEGKSVPEWMINDKR